MRTYLSFFRMRFINSLQYRAAAYAGIVTQFAFGFGMILVYSAFYRSNLAIDGITLKQLSTYVWLQQALLALFAYWVYENDIFDSISNGNVAYELCRPVSIYEMWFSRVVANRLARVSLRCLPILVVASLMPKSYSFTPPSSFSTFLWFLLSLALGLFLMVGINMLVYISAFYTVSTLGTRILTMSLFELFAGVILPFPLLPKKLELVFNLLPFASIQSTPGLIYNGYIENVYRPILLQVFWLAVVIVTGKLLMKKALKRVVVQGG